MNTANRVLDCAWPVTQLAGLVFLLLTPRFRGRGLLIAFFTLSLLGSVGWRILETLRDGAHTDGMSMDRVRKIESVWVPSARSLFLSAQCLLLGFVVVTWKSRRDRANAHDETGSHMSSEVSCPKCSEKNPAGQTRCSQCGRSLLPLPLAIITLLGIVVNVLVGFGAIYVLGNLFAVGLALGAVVMIGVNLAARRGWHWAWTFLQWNWGLSIVPLVVVAAAKGGIMWWFPPAAALVAGLLIWSLNTLRVRGFCAGDDPAL